MKLYKDTHVILIITLVAVLGCAAMKRAAYTAGGAAAGAGVGLIAGPVGAVVGGAAGAVTGQALGESSAFESGDITGKGASKISNEQLIYDLKELSSKVSDIEQVASTSVSIADAAEKTASNPWIRDGIIMTIILVIVLKWHSIYHNRILRTELGKLRSEVVLNTLKVEGVVEKESA